MSTVCKSTPTATRTDVIFTFTEFVSYTDSVSTLPGEVSTSFFSTDICPGQSTSVFGFALARCTPTMSPFLITLDGSTTVVKVPITAILDTSVTQTTTLFGSTCSVEAGAVVSPSPPIQSPAIQSSSSATTPVITPGSTQSIFASASSATLASVVSSPQTTAASAKPFPIAAVAGGAAGGLALFAGAAFMAWKYVRKPSGIQRLTGKNYKYDSVKISDYMSHGKEGADFYQQNFQQPQPQPQDPAAQNQNGSSGDEQTPFNPSDYNYDQLQDPLEDFIKKQIEDRRNSNSHSNSTRLELDNHNRLSRPLGGGGRRSERQDQLGQVQYPLQHQFDTGGPGYVPAPPATLPPRYSHASQASESSISYTESQYQDDQARQPLWSAHGREKKQGRPTSYQGVGGAKYTAGYSEPGWTAGGQPYRYPPGSS